MVQIHKQCKQILAKKMVKVKLTPLTDYLSFSLQERRGGIKESSPTFKEWLLPPVAGY